MLKDNRGLVFIVDISGYSQFIREISPSEEMLVIRCLLNAIIEQNLLSFKISEIEGDAVLFYQFGTPPLVEEVLKQFAGMLNKFRQILSTHHSKFPSVKKLSLKAIAHYGYMAEYKVDRFRKLYGNTLVDAHRLLKNSVPSNTYMLLTTDYLQEVPDFPLDYSTTCGTYQCDLYDIGSLCYTYFPFEKEIAGEEQMDVVSKFFQN